MNFGSSVISIGSYCVSGTINAAVSQIGNFGSSQWTCTGAWTFQSNHTIVPGTSTVTFAGNSATVTTAGKSFNNVVCNKTAGQTLTQSGALVCRNLTVNTGNFTTGNNAITASGNVLLGGGTLNLGTSDLTMSGNGVTARISATTRTTNNASFIFTGTSATLDLANSGDTTIHDLVLAAGASYTWTPTANTLTISTYVAGDWDNTTWVSGTPGTPYHISAPAGIVLDGVSVTDAHNTGTLIDAIAPTNHDGGHNEGFRFRVGVAAHHEAKMAIGIANSMGI
jgi:hypothetical protein